ncbi:MULTISPECIES: ferrous iron transport protein B [unclassified Enterococcus]|uniref:ferrous iron transport protein B n=1 Tax=unclassified Enterococcus TaxID=2608891 RepID=UPI001554027D|nr:MULTISPECIES: ferrous iron transport protein B [unclassified Enterococcus]MBS7577552.1 ferrous iron transport protein B [Enterococcus sp. MMGLQ5-2]MBS7584949.1 ferrous iron transport protein B [Enterococcus sp. MMGLQ5-1]NPD12804.1 ferrous iron transport protein B [Enterococcus sp. MMGLQ5-1]NPD37385.1 ferrous iron transport protein B [Enterococcus sp. MMGLQ5-2]
MKGSYILVKHIALAGNPNSGKTTLFNLLTGSKQRVGNWPGVTVERKTGEYKKNREILIQDLPGIYSLSPYTPEEIVSRDYLINNQPNVVLNIVDATNLERNLYLTIQLLETGLPVVIALNMVDVLEKTDKIINTEKLSYATGVPVVSMSAIKNKGVDKAMQIAAKHQKNEELVSYDARLETALTEIIEILGNTVPTRTARWYAIKLFERDQAAYDALDLSNLQKKEIEDIISITEHIFKEDAESIVINERYNFINEIVQLASSDSKELRFNFSDKIDRIVTNRVLALPIFALVMWLVYFVSIQTVGAIGTDWVNDVLFGELVPGFANSALTTLKVAPWLNDLVVNGIIAGCGAVLGFVPQIAVLFICLGILEDTGYMSRVAFVMDRLFRRFGLSGKSFIPILIATGCGVPGVMASRTIESEKDRRITIMVTTFIPCSAKLPIIALIAGAFFPHSSWVAPSAYFIGIAAIIFSGIALKKFRLLAGEVSPFIMELPSYHMPKWSTVLRYSFDKSMSFIKRAGTIIFVMNVFIWFTSSYNFAFQSVDTDKSMLASFGKTLAPIFAPLGWGSWQGTVASITGLLAKETVVGTFGVLFSNYTEVSDNGTEIWQQMAAHFTPLAAYSLLVFNLLCAPCFAAIGAIHREMGDFKWTFLAVGYQCGLAYVVSFIIYQYGLAISTNHLSLATIIATILLGFAIYFVIRKPKQTEKPIVNLSYSKL